MANMYEKLSQLKNIICVLFVIKRGDQISASLSETLAAYKKMLNCQFEKRFFGIVLTHCDINLQN